MGEHKQTKNATMCGIVIAIIAVSAAVCNTYLYEADRLHATALQFMRVSN